MGKNFITAAEARTLNTTTDKLISQAFKSTTSQDYANVKYFKNEVEYVSYRHRLFCCYMKNGDNLFSTHLIIATGLKYEPVLINNEEIPGIFYSIDRLSSKSAEQAVLVISNQEPDIKFVTEIAKRYQQAYLSTTEVDFIKNLPAAAAKKIAKLDNLNILSNTSIKKIAFDINTSLYNIEFDNYSSITCAAIYAKTTTKPALDFVPKKLLLREADEPIVTDNCESTLVPKCFVAGSCLNKYTKTMEQKLVNLVLKDF